MTQTEVIMKLTRVNIFTAAAGLAVATLAGCNGASQSIPPTAAGTKTGGIKAHSGTSNSPIQHIVLIIQENRTFNNLFATFPGATGSTTGLETIGTGSHRRTEQVQLEETRLYDRQDPNHSYTAFLTGYDGGQLDGFNRIKPYGGKGTEGTGPYKYTNPNGVQPSWGLANAMFQTQGSESFDAHQDLIRGGTEINATASLIDNPPYGHGVWGCDSPTGTVTSLITTNLQLEKQQGPFPCTTSFPTSDNNYLTLRDLLDAKYLSWKYYAPAIGQDGGIWSAFDVIAPVRYGPEWYTNVSSPPTNIFNDISSGNLAALTWVVPDGADSDHPGNGSDTGPSWVSSVVNAVGESQYWKTTAVIVVWDDWGGFYDPVPPPLPRDNQGGPGFRVPMIVISPYARQTSASQAGYISNTVYEFGSIVQFIEDTFNLGRLGTTDETTNSMSDMFDFYQYPRPYQTVKSKYSKEYFIRRGPTHTPVDLH
jgi:phospholipase C